MIKKIQEKLQNISTKLKNLNELYIDYILCITFLNLIILKINQMFFQIPSIYLYLIIIILSILFINQWFLIINKIKNTYIFNFILYYFLILKNSLYGIIFEYSDYIKHEKYSKLIVFLTGFILSSWFLNIFFFFFNYSYNITILLFFFLLLINIFNLIEKKIIFTSENINQKSQQKMDYNYIKGVLKIENKTFNKNKSLFYIQKRYVGFNEVKNMIKKYGITIITSATAGSLFTGYLQHSSVQVQKDQLIIQKDQFEYQKQKDSEEFIYKRKKDKEDFEKWREELNLKKIELKQKSINEVDQKIEKYQLDMDTSTFWNKIDHSKQIEFLKEKRLEIQKDFEKRKINEKEEDNFSSNKKIKLDNNDILED